MARLIFRTGPYAGKGVSIPEGKTLTVGRNRDLELPLPDTRLSRRHCQIEDTLTGYVLRDLASTNGTFINGKRLDTEVALNHLDVILIGDTEIEFQMPEAIDQGQTRIGPAAKAHTPVVPIAMQVSPALEPATGGSTAENVILPAARIPIEGLPVAARAPMTAPPPTAAVMKDPLAIAIAELDLPLPPEPTISLPPRPQVAFCDQCNGSIPIVDVDLCIAKEIDGKLYCRECVAKGVPGGAGGAFPQPGNWGKSASERDIDDIMKGLDQVEEIPFDGGGRRGSSARPAGHTSKQVPVAGPPKTESAFERLLNEEPEERMKPKPKVPPGKAPPAPKLDELLGDEFEEIG